MSDRQTLGDAAVEVDRAAHDLNNLCASLLGFAELTLASLPGDARARAYVQEIAGSARKTIALAERLRELAETLRTSSDG